MKLKTAKNTMYTLLGLFCLFMVMLWLTKLLLFSYLTIGSVVAIGIINIAYWKCPYCGKNIGSMENVHYCRNCGREIEL